MKHGYINHLFLVCTLAFITFSCIKENAQVDDTICNEGSFRATVEGSENAKTVLENDGAVVWWEPNDEIQVFCGNQKGVFTSNATAASATTTFVGETHFSSEEGTPFLAVYPNSEDVTYDGSEAVVTIPHEQIAEAGTFDRRAFVMMAESNNRILNFKNLCGGIKISVAEGGIYKIVLRGNSKEVLAGKVKAQFSEGVPVVTEVLEGQSAIELRRENDAAFERGKWYFISCLPSALSNGFSVDMYRSHSSLGYDCIGRYTKNDGNYSIQRSQWCRIKEASSAASFFPFSSSNKLFYTTTDNNLANLYSSTTSKVAKHYATMIGGTKYGIIEFNDGVSSLSQLFDNETRTKIESVIIPSCIASLGSAFSGCTGLTSVRIPNSVTTIGSFYNCTNLQSVYINDLAVWCGKSGYVGDSSYSLYLNEDLITDLVIPDEVTSINAYAFYHCSGLKSATFHDGISSIGYCAFAGCTDLTSITFPNSITSIGTSIGQSAFAGCTGLTSITFPNSITSIEAGAFRECTGLKSATIPNSISTIGDNAFSRCSNLSSLTISGDGPSLALSKTPFTGCTITDLSFSEGITSIVDNALKNWSSLQSVSFPTSLTAIGTQAFYGCTALKKIFISDLAAWCRINFSGHPLNEAYYYQNGELYLNGELITDLVIPNSITEISPRAFLNCGGIKSVIIPDGVTSIGASAFFGCTSLKSITIPSSVTTVESNSFNMCSSSGVGIYITDLVAWCNISFKAGWIYPQYGNTWNLFLNGVQITNLVIPDRLTKINDYSFLRCSGFSSVTIPNSVTSIGQSAFYECTGLSSVTISNCVPSVEQSTFYGCTGLSSVTIPNSVTSIEQSAFYGCTGLTSVTIPNSVTAIAQSAFYGCTGLTSITIPNSVTSIGQSAFYGCTGLTDIVVLPTTPPSGGRGMFNNNADSRMIYVPFNSVGDYQTAEYWKDYSSSITYIQ